LDCLGILFPDRTSGDSFSLLPETLRSTGEGELLAATLGKATFPLSFDTLRVPLTAAPLPLDVRLALAVMPRPIAALGVLGAPIAAVGV
jgi:hypothetical protein